MFILPSRFNIIHKMEDCSVGTNILVPVGAPTKATQQHLELVATGASKERNIVSAMQQMRDSTSRRNNIDTTHGMRSHEKGVAMYTYSRLTPISFYSNILGELFNYMDYTVYINMCLLHLKCRDNIKLRSDYAAELMEWMRFYELHAKFDNHEIRLYRCTALWKVVDVSKAMELVVEASCRMNVGERTSEFSSLSKRKAS